MVRFLTRSGIVVVAVSLVSFNLQGIAQQEVSIEHATPQQMAGIAKDNSRHFGDDPDDGGPIAKDLSPSLDPSSVGAAMRKVANWQLKRSQPYFDRIWTWSVLYSGFVAASDSLSDAKYRDAMEEMGKKFDWELRSHLPDADDQSVGQTYLELYLLKKDPAMMVPTRSELDALLAAPHVAKREGKVIPWWWCDALFMAPPVWARMYAVTGDRKYIAYLDEEWIKTSDLLYDKQEHLYARDADYISKTEANGKKLFWSRGNGWVMGGLVRTLQYLPQDDPARGKYVTQLKEMAERVASLQGSDGLWGPGCSIRAITLSPRCQDQPYLPSRWLGESIKVFWIRRCTGQSLRKPGRVCWSMFIQTDDWDVSSKRAQSRHHSKRLQVTPTALVRFCWLAAKSAIWRSPHQALGRATNRNRASAL